MFGSSEMMYVELRAKKLWKQWKLYFAEHVKVSSSHVQNTPHPYYQPTKLKIMNTSTKTKVVIKFGGSEIICGIEGQKLWKVYTSPNMRSHPHMYRTHLHTSKFNSSEMMYVEIRAKKLWSVLEEPPNGISSFSIKIFKIQYFW